MTIKDRLVHDAFVILQNELNCDAPSISAAYNAISDALDILDIYLSEITDTKDDLQKHIEELRETVRDSFDNYEIEGFSKVFISPYNLFENCEKSYQGEPFYVVGRVLETTEDNKGFGTAELDALPMWIIEFKDGHTMGAYPEEIIPSAIREEMWREEDKKYLDLM